jgi:hypothetical protein
VSAVARCEYKRRGKDERKGLGGWFGEVGSRRAWLSLRKKRIASGASRTDDGRRGVCLKHRIDGDAGAKQVKKLDTGNRYRSREEVWE